MVMFFLHLFLRGADEIYKGKVVYVYAVWDEVSRNNYLTSLRLKETRF